MKKLLASVLCAGLFAIGCSDQPTSTKPTGTGITPRTPISPVKPQADKPPSSKPDDSKKNGVNKDEGKKNDTNKDDKKPGGK